MSRANLVTRRIGILDWGIGGLGFWRLLKRASPGVTSLYVSDSGAPPYGTLPPRVLAQRVGLAIRWFAQRGVAQVVVACNAASSVLARVPDVRLAPEHGVGNVHLLGVIQPTLRALIAAPRCSIGIFGGRRTIQSRAYRTPLVAAGFHVRQRVAQPLSALVEAGRITGPAVEREVERILTPIAGCEVLVPACTHYAALLPLFRRVAPAARFVDPAQLTLQALRGGSRRESEIASEADEFWTTGAAAGFRRGALAAFGVEVAVCRKLRL